MPGPFDESSGLVGLLTNCSYRSWYNSSLWILFNGSHVFNILEILWKSLEFSYSSFCTTKTSHNLGGYFSFFDFLFFLLFFVIFNWEKHVNRKSHFLIICRRLWHCQVLEQNGIIVMFKSFDDHVDFVGTLLLWSFYNGVLLDLLFLWPLSLPLPLSLSLSLSLTTSPWDEWWSCCKWQHWRWRN
jgi:hypothetical protein